MSKWTNKGEGKSVDKSAEELKAVLRETSSYTEMYSRYKHYEQWCFRQVMINGHTDHVVD